MWTLPVASWTQLAEHVLLPSSVLVLLLVSLVPIAIGCMIARKRENNAIPSIPWRDVWSERENLASGKMHLVVTKWGRKFQGLFRFQGSIVVNDKDLAHDLYVKQDPTFTDRSGKLNYFLHKITFDSQDIGNRNYDAELRMLRRAAHAALQVTGAGRQQFELIVRDELADLSADLEARRGAALDPAPLLYGAVANILASLLFGEKYSYYSEEVQMLKKINDSFLKVIQNPEAPELLFNKFTKYLLWLPLPRYTKKKQELEEALEVRDQAFTRIVEKHKENFDGVHARSAFEHLLLAQRQQGSDVFTDKMIHGVLMDLIFAGTVTTFTTITGLVLSLAANQEAQRRAQQQIDETIGASRCPRGEDKERVPYVSALILEQSRLQSVAPFGVPRRVARQTCLGGHRIRRGDMVLVNHWAIHHDPEHWEHPNQFHPEHFLDSQGLLLPPDQYKRKGFVPFGAGRRVCMGESLAKSRLFLMTATLLQRFRILPADDEIRLESDASVYRTQSACSAPPYTVRFVAR